MYGVFVEPADVDVRVLQYIVRPWLLLLEYD